MSSSAAHGSKENGSAATIEENVCKVAVSPNICESPSGPDPTGSDRSGEEQGSAHCAGEPVTAAGGDASERSVSSAVVTSKQLVCLFAPKKRGEDVVLSKATRGHIALTNQLSLILFLLLHEYKAKEMQCT